MGEVGGKTGRRDLDAVVSGANYFPVEVLNWNIWWIILMISSIISSPTHQALFLSFTLHACPSHPHCLAQSGPLRLRKSDEMNYWLWLESLELEHWIIYSRVISPLRPFFGIQYRIWKKHEIVRHSHVVFRLSPAHFCKRCILQPAEVNKSMTAVNHRHSTGFYGFQVRPVVANMHAPTNRIT